MKYDYLIVGSGLFGSVFARQAADAGKKCLVIDRRNHIGGNCYSEDIDGICVHKYGAHIFHTSDEEVWNYVNRFCTMTPYVHSPMARYKDKMYNLPFNMNTFYALWGVKTPKEAQEKIESQIQKQATKPENLEEQALSLVGRDIYNILVKEYTEKQWGRSCKELPSFIIRRLPLRFTYNNNYFNDIYQGIPREGYTHIFEGLLKGIDVELNADFIEEREKYEGIAEKIVYTGRLDELFTYMHGELEYRSLTFDTVKLDTDDFQGCAVVNYTSHKAPYTRIIEHKHFDRNNAVTGKTVVTYEYPQKWERGIEAYYPVNSSSNDLRSEFYKKEAKKRGVIYGGRLADYKYYDMDKVIRNALDTADSELHLNENK